jgi:hypothetical protein
VVLIVFETDNEIFWALEERIPAIATAPYMAEQQRKITDAFSHLVIIS